MANPKRFLSKGRRSDVILALVWQMDWDRKEFGNHLSRPQVIIGSSHSGQKEEKANSRNKEITNSKEDRSVWKVPWGKDNTIFLLIAIVKLVPLLNTSNELSRKARIKSKLILFHIQFGASVRYANRKVQYIQVMISQPQHCWCLALRDFLCTVLSSFLEFTQ